MKEIGIEEALLISGDKPKFLNVVFGAAFGAAFGAITTGFVGLMTSGPAGLVAGIGYGAYMGAAGALVKEGAYGAVEIKDEFLLGPK